ncbi:hypothetical protein MKW98_005545 [Papaver atlanticum]|uniref:Aminotransferase-like plant mobile domain-containing protein n=1 Tax=Papaver atlanticum TaxID=357466 RepID=A0AAD4STA7_9MAGN|nr:hypothetical protein MKW98_005545 [Papaver atlanticum]
MVKTKWPIDKDCVEVQEYVKKSGLYSLIKYGHDKIDRALINAFRERWYPETNTYHLPFGEMTITTEDVERITRLNAKGKVVEGVFGAKTMTWDYTYDLIKRTLGKTKKELEIEKAFGGTAKKLERKLKLNWLRKKFTSKKNDSKKRKEQCARAYLLYVIGSIVCGDKSGSRVNAYFLQCLENLEEVNSYSWATACLAWIYHHLGQGSRTEVYSMAGCMTILQVWIYDHFPVLERHNFVGGYEECNPRASLYVPIQPERTLELDLVDLHEKLDDLTEEKVTWDPYKSIRDGSIHQVAHYIVPLKCFDVVEWHNPNRVLRQFGVIQDKPKGVFLDKEKTVSKPSSFKSYYHNLDGYSWSAWDTCLIPKGSLRCKVLNPWDCEDGYKKWFSEVSHTG